MERICFLVKSCVTSRLHPYGTIDQRIKRDAQLTAIKLKYNLQGKLDLSTNRLRQETGKPRLTETVYDECEILLSISDTNFDCGLIKFFVDPVSALRPPCLRTFSPPEGERSRLLGYLYGYYGVTTTQNRKAIAQATPVHMMRWGKVRRLDRIEKIRGSVAMRNNNRDSSYIRVRHIHIACDMCILIFLFL